MSIIAGIDYSYTSPAICVWDTETEFQFSNLRFYGMTKTKKYCGLFGDNILMTAYPIYKTEEERFREIAKWSRAVLESEGVESVVLEGYALGSRSGMIFQMAENTSLLKQYLDTAKIDFKTPTPTEVKKFFTGRGAHTGKNDRERKLPMILRAEEMLGVKFMDILGSDKEHTKPIDDLCDAFAIMCMHDAAPVESQPPLVKTKKPKKAKTK